MTWGAIHTPAPQDSHGRRRNPGRFAAGLRRFKRHWSAQTTHRSDVRFGPPAMCMSLPVCPPVRQRLAARLLDRPWHTRPSSRDGRDPCTLPGRFALDREDLNAVKGD